MTLLGVTGILVGVGLFSNRVARRAPVALRGGLAAMFLLTGFAHFIGMREDMVAMVPPHLPAPELLVSITGVADLGRPRAQVGRPAAPRHDHAARVLDSDLDRGPGPFPNQRTHP